LLPVVYLLNLAILFSTPLLIYRLAFGLQTLFYLTALAGIFFRRLFPGPLLVPYYFVFMNLSLYAGFFRYLKGSQSVLWSKAARKQVVQRQA
jgi:hypothetical protein